MTMRPSSLVRLSVLRAACIVAAGVAGVGCGPSTDAGTEAAGFRTVAVERGRLQVSVEATGTLQPATQVEVGSRVSGQLLRVLADYNDVVKAGQLLAEIDPAPFKARQNEARASVAGARAELLRSEADLAVKEQTVARARELNTRQLNSTAELQGAEGAFQMAKAQIAVAQAGLERTQAALASATNDVDATRITSPIDGLVLARAVEAGQTVAASLQAPRLFVIAKALDALEVVAKVDESDLAVVKTDAAGSVTVDAFPGKTFQAKVSQIRIDPLNENGVVTFPVVLTVDNSEALLLPGMTATVTIQGPPIDDALIVPAAALRFVPSTSTKKATGGTVWVLDGGTTGTPTATPPATPAPAGAPPGRARSGSAPGATTATTVGGTPRAITVTVIAKAGTRVQVSGEGLVEGTAVIIEETGKKANGRKPPRVF